MERVRIQAWMALGLPVPHEHRHDGVRAAGADLLLASGRTGGDPARLGAVTSPPHPVPLPARTGVALLAWASVSRPPSPPRLVGARRWRRIRSDRGRVLERAALPRERRPCRCVGPALGLLPLLGRLGAHARQLPAPCGRAAARPGARGRMPTRTPSRPRLRGMPAGGRDAGDHRGGRPLRRRARREHRRRCGPSGSTPLVEVLREAAPRRAIDRMARRGRAAARHPRCSISPV